MSNKFWIYIIIFIVSQAVGVATPLVLRLTNLETDTDTLLVSSLFVANVLAVGLFFVVRPPEVTCRSLSSPWQSPTANVTWRYLAAAPALIVAVNLIQENCLDFLPDIVGEQDLNALMNNPVGVLTVCCLGPVAEELLFRAGVQGALQRRAASPTSLRPVVWSALIFSLVHMNPAQMSAAFILGLLLGAAYQQTRSIMVPIIIHVLNNSSAVALAHITSADTTLTSIVGGPIFALFVGVACIIWTILCLKSNFSLYNKV